MSAVEELEALRAKETGIETAAYVDHASGTVLCASAAIAPPQERLDAFCALAAGLLNGPAGPVDTAAKLTSRETLVIIRAPDTPDEALCLVGAPDMDVLKMAKLGRGTAAQLQSA